MAQQQKGGAEKAKPVEHAPQKTDKSGEKYQHSWQLNSWRGTSESDLSFIGVGPYEDTLRRLDGGIDHKNFNKKFWTFRG